MKYFVIFLILIGFIGIIMPNVFASENLFYGMSSFEQLPSAIVPDNSQIIEIKLQYQNGPYSLSDFKPIIDVNPKEAAPYVHIEFEPLGEVFLHSVNRIFGTITVDKEIPNKMIFLNISYVGTNSNGISLRSGWNDSAIIEIRENRVGGTLDRTVYPVSSPLKQFKEGVTIDKIQCRDNLQLILKTSNNSPTCVKPETKTKLLERGWGEHAPIPEPEIIKETDFDSEKYYEEFDSGSPLIYLDTSNPVLDNDNCERYAYWLTKYQKEKLDRYEDYPRYPPWGNQIFPLVDYCIKNGDLIKTIVNDKIQWSFSGISGNSEPEFKDEKITIIKISKGEIVSEKAIKFNGWTNQPNQEIMLTVTAPNGNVISTGKLSSMNNGTFVDFITTGGPLWKQQDGIYLVTVQQGNDPTNSAYFELDLKDGNIITGK